MDAKVYTRRLSGTSLARLLKALRPQLPFAIVERLAAPDFPASHEPLSPDDWPQGQAFGPSLEVRWAPRGTGFDTRLICARPPSARWIEYLDLTRCEVCQQFYYLWGPGDIALGRSLDYRAMPPGSGRPQLVVIEYYDRDNGTLVLAQNIEMKWEGKL